MPDKNEQDVTAVPAGSLPLSDEDNSPPVPKPEPGEAAPAPAPAGDEGKEGDGKGQEMILGKFKSVDDLAKSYEALEKDHGRIGAEVGSLRKQTEFQQKQTELLLNQLAALGQDRAAQPPVKTGAPDFDQAVAELMAKVEDGTMDLGQAFAQTIALTSQKAETIAVDAVQRARREENALSAKDRFLKENADFTALQQTGELQAIKAENPMHDDFSAYHEYKRREAITKLDAETKAAYDRGMAEAAKLAEGAQAAGRVSGKSGTQVRAPAPGSGPKTDGEINQGMLDVLKKMRSGQ